MHFLNEYLIILGEWFSGFYLLALLILFHEIGHLWVGRLFWQRAEGLILGRGIPLLHIVKKPKDGVYYSVGHDDGEPKLGQTTARLTLSFVHLTLELRHFYFSISPYLLSGATIFNISKTAELSAKQTLLLALGGPLMTYVLSVVCGTIGWVVIRHPEISTDLSFLNYLAAHIEVLGVGLAFFGLFGFVCLLGVFTLGNPLLSPIVALSLLALDLSRRKESFIFHSTGLLSFPISLHQFAIADKETGLLLISLALVFWLMSALTLLALPLFDGWVIWRLILESAISRFNLSVKEITVKFEKYYTRICGFVFLQIVIVGSFNDLLDKPLPAFVVIMGPVILVHLIAFLKTLFFRGSRN